jgi:hypothetical protein
MFISGACFVKLGRYKTEMAAKKLAAISGGG